MELLQRYFPGLTANQLEQSMPWPRLPQWNQRMNVISRKDMEELEVHHLLHSLGIARVVQFEAGTHVLDVGTGGGFRACRWP